jgi:ABC-type glycerol-3-phosphate transport system substrate-binding protein
MKRRRISGLLAILGALLAVALGATAAAAQAPVKETIRFSDTFEDEFLSEACGVEVTTAATGRITFLDFLDRLVGRRT